MSILLLLVLLFAIGAALFYVTTLDFEVGTGHTEERDQMREGTYRIVDEEKDTDKENRQIIGK